MKKLKNIKLLNGRLFSEVYSDYKGRLNQLEFMFYTSLLAVFSYVILAIFGNLFGIGGLSLIGGLIFVDTENVFGIILAMLGLLVMVFAFRLCFMGIRLMVKRMQDTGRSGRWILLSLIPWVNYVLFLYLILWNGTKGNNKYGSQPKAIKSENIWWIILLFVMVLAIPNFYSL